MEYKDTVDVIQFIRPNSEFTLRGENLEWLDKNQTEPTEAEIEAGRIAYQELIASKAEAQAEAKAALLDRLGITADEAKLLLS